MSNVSLYFKQTFKINALKLYTLYMEVTLYTFNVPSILTNWIYCTVHIRLLPFILRSYSEILFKASIATDKECMWIVLFSSNINEVNLYLIKIIKINENQLYFNHNIVSLRFIN